MWIKVHNNGARLSRYTYRCAVLPDASFSGRSTTSLDSLNAPTGAWCPLTYPLIVFIGWLLVSMHLQVRGAP